MDRRFHANCGELNLNKPSRQLLIHGPPGSMERGGARLINEDHCLKLRGEAVGAAHYHTESCLHSDVCMFAGISDFLPQEGLNLCWCSSRGPACTYELAGRDCIAHDDMRPEAVFAGADIDMASALHCSYNRN